MKIPKENSLDFSKFSTTIKYIALYNPKNYLPAENKIDNSHGVIKDNSLYSINLEENIKIEKNHGIYGLTFNYIWTKKEILITMNLILYLKIKNVILIFYNMD
jgi:hypothetical protein